MQRILIPKGIALINQVSLQEKHILTLLTRSGVARENIEVASSNDPNLGQTLAFMK